MIKRIKTEELKPGMFVHDLNCGWIDHPFVFNTFKVKDAAMIEKIVQYGIRELYIDTRQGLDVADAPTQEEVNAQLHERMVEAVQAKPKPLPPTPIREEMVVAHAIHNEAHKVVHSIMSDIRLGKQIEVEKVEPVVERITDSIFRNKDALTSLSRIKQKDDYTFQHSVSVCALLVSFAHALDYERGIIMEAGMGGLLHDIGKMKVPDHILNKPGGLTAPEFEIMQSHAALGRELLLQTPGIPETAIQITGQHHERFDGTGYPDKLKDDGISPFGQMAAIVDVYDALTSNRIYHQGMEPTAALKKLFEWSKFHFNEEMVQHFIRVIGIYPVGSLVALESGLLAIVVEAGKENLLHPLVRAVFDTRQGCTLPPRDIDLSQPGKSGSDRIVGHELPQKWGIDPLKYL